MLFLPNKGWKLYNENMENFCRNMTRIEREDRRFREALRSQEIEGNPLTPDEIAMFDRFHCEGWSHEQCLEYIAQKARELS